MRIWRFEFGFIQFYGDKKSHWAYEKPSCGCRLLSLGKVYLTLLGRECYINNVGGSDGKN